MRTKYQISATITGFSDHTVFYLHDIDTQSDMNSAAIFRDKFEMEGDLNSAPKLLWLRTKKNGKTYYCILFIGNETVTVNGDISDMPYDMQITGSSIQDVHNLWKDQTKELYKQRQELINESKPFWTGIKLIDQKVHLIRMDFIREHYNSYWGLEELFNLADRFSADSVQNFYDQLTPEYKTSHYGKRIYNYLNSGKPVKILDEGIGAGQTCMELLAGSGWHLRVNCD